MWHAVWLAASAFLWMGCSTQGPAITEFAGAPRQVGDCLRAGYKLYSFDTPTTIPDGDPDGVMVGPLWISDDGSFLEGVVLALNISHSYTGDLALRLDYDEDNDGTCEMSVPVELYRARADGCTAQEPFAYPDVLDGTYFFRDEAAGTGAPADPIAGEGVPSFSAFDGLKKGGSFYLAVTDNLPEETGVVWGWTLAAREPQSVCRKR